METERVSFDLSEREYAEMERLMAFAGLKTKREFASSALALFRWASDELLHNRTIASMDALGRSVKQLELPGLAPFATAGLRADRAMPSAEQLHESAEAPARPAREALDEARRILSEVGHAEGRDRAQGERAVA